MTKRAKPKASDTALKAVALKTQITDAKRAAAKLEREEIKRLGRLALDAGLGDVRVNDKELTAGLSDLAARFH